MFMPVEPAYIEIMRTQRDLFNYGYRKNVILVSHTTLMPILRTVANLWMVERVMPRRAILVIVLATFSMPCVW